jgi:hypothetical protein
MTDLNLLDKHIVPAKYLFSEAKYSKGLVHRQVNYTTACGVNLSITKEDRKKFKWNIPIMRIAFVLCGTVTALQARLQDQVHQYRFCASLITACQPEGQRGVRGEERAKLG